MGYLFMVLSALLDGVKGCLSKPVSRHASTPGDSLLVNLCRTVLCTLFGLVFCLVTLGRMPAGQGGTLAITVLSGVSTALFMVSWLMAIRTGAFMTVTVLGTASCVLPILLSALCFGEALLLRHLIGAALLIVAAWLLCTYQTKTKGRFSVKQTVWVVCLFLSNGLASFAQKIFVHTVPGGVTADYNFFTYLFAAAAMLLFLPIARREGFGQPPRELLRKTGLLIVCLSLSLYFVDYFRTLAAVTVPAGILYPTSSGLVLLINQGYSIVFLKERPGPRGWIGLLLSIAAMICINL